jgi:hypothetical protein
MDNKTFIEIVVPTIALVTLQALYNIYDATIQIKVLK